MLTERALVRSELCELNFVRTVCRMLLAATHKSYGIGGRTVAVKSCPTVEVNQPGEIGLHFIAAPIPQFSFVHVWKRIGINRRCASFGDESDEFVFCRQAPAIFRQLFRLIPGEFLNFSDTPLAVRPTLTGAAALPG